MSPLVGKLSSFAVSSTLFHSCISIPYENRKEMFFSLYLMTKGICLCLLACRRGFVLRALHTNKVLSFVRLVLRKACSHRRGSFWSPFAIPNLRMMRREHHPEERLKLFRIESHGVVPSS
ncbi:hypothetical protein AVEN_11156-1 [Araneus ventricosus]|uniref:Uncharacterized protein n=1 Tax=Araneus ventricosus TaxID=182803 RepID=A0A4Y2PFF9_ARAVE|nr:hypothetical protein AVEN_3789-1 [Araneus ventricosus]GBN50884.1 hypothetical protein AVEN_11156-1 [Araneus ventricosus]